MKRKILLILLVIFITMSIVGFAACSITSGKGNSSPTSSDESSDSSGTTNALNTLKLLSFETVQKKNVDDVGEIQNLSAVLENGNLTADKFTTEEKRSIEETDTDVVELIATVKNEIRDPFIDLVLYVSYLDTRIVFNEGNGAYVCASTTKLENNVWVTKISLTLNLAFDDEYMCHVEIEEINFLHGGADVWKTNLDNNGIKRKDFGFMGDFDAEYGEDGEFRVGNIVYEIIRENEVRITGNTITEDIDLEIPMNIVIGKTYKNKTGIKYSIVEIGDGAFRDCGFIKSLTVPETVRYIGNNAFKNCGEFSRNITSSTEVAPDAFDKTVAVDMTKTQLIVAVCGDGLNKEWTIDVGRRFEEQYAHYSFEEGKRGVHILFDFHRMTDDIDYSRTQVLVGDNLNYKALVASDKLMDITDVVTGTLTNLGENNTIENKLYDEQKAFLKTDGKYYAVPNAEGYYGLTYDADLFDEYDLYFLKNGTFGDLSCELSAGPDGLYGTYDDGLPATYDEFFTLCNRMVMKGVTPMTFSGQYAPYYMSNVVNSLIADYNSYDNERVYYNLNGTINNYVKGFDGDVPILESRTITESNGYDVFRQAGYYYGFSFLDKLYNGGRYLSNKCYSSVHSFTEAQAEFVISSTKNQPIAMLAEGNWWYNESQPVLNEMENIYGPEYSATARNLKFMPLPKATQNEVGAGRTLFNALNSYMAVSKNTPDNLAMLAKCFIQFCNSDENLQDYTVKTNVLKALKYDITDETYDKLTTFGKSVVDLKRNSKTVYNYSDNSFHNNTRFVNGTNFKYSGQSNLLSAVRQGDFNAQEYFVAFAEYWKEKWEQLQ